MANPDHSDTLVLSSDQKTVLLTAKAWWQEGELRLEYLSERSRYRDLLEQIATARDRFRSVVAPVVADVLPLLRLVRIFAPNGAVNRSRETDAFARALHTLLFADIPLSERLSGFLETVRGVGALTASQLLFLVYPDRYPFVRPDVVMFLTMTREQKRLARKQGRTLFGEAGQTSVTMLLAHFVWLEAIREVVGVSDFADLDAIVRHAKEMPRASLRKRRTTPSSVRETEATYTTTSAPEPTEADVLRYLEAFAQSQRLTYPPLALRNYYLCQKTKPFVILAGLSGTGKTRLTELFSECITGNLRSRYRLLPVRPDWSDPSPLLGYHNALTGQYIGTPFLELLQEAGRSENRDRAYFVCLDEMNLARAEHYLADVLSAMETRAHQIPLAGTFDATTLPPNVFLTGTVNMEEGTHPFGLKVLDRANVIEFGEVRFARATVDLAPSALPEISPRDRETLFLANRQEMVADAESRLAIVSPVFVERFYQTLSSLSDILNERGFAFGYRVRDESLRYIAHSFAPDGVSLLIEGSTGAENFQTALDLQLLQKVLPRLSGTQERLGGFLKRLMDWAEREGFPLTYAKLVRIRRRAEEDGIVSFWE